MINFAIPLRVAQAVFGLAVLGLSGYVANWYHTDSLMSSPSQVNFLVFVGVFSLLSIVYLEGVTRWAPKASHPYAAMGFEVLNVIFFFAGFIAEAVFLNSLVFCRGAVCGSARASTVLAAFAFLAWGVSMVMMATDIFRTGFGKKAPVDKPAK